MNANTLVINTEALHPPDEPEPGGRSDSTRFDLVAAADIDAALKSQWKFIRQTNCIYQSPFFSPEFIVAASDLLPNVEVGLATQGERLVAIFPFQRCRRSTARPVGLGINDAHGLVALPNARLSLREMMHECKVKSFPFHAAPRETSDIAEFQIGATRSYLADLTVDPLGYENYLRNRSHTIDKQAQKTRRMIRELGPLRFEFDCRDSAMLQHLFDLKCEQYKRTHIFNILGVPWIRQLLTSLHQRPAPGLRGILNVLYAGEKPVALHYGMLEGNLLHYWFPVFDPKVSFGSPGTQLFLEVAREAAARGVTAIDMGYGEQPYKTKLTNVITEMCYGLVDENPFRRRWYEQKKSFSERLSRLQFKEAIKPWARRLLPSFGRGVYQA